MAGDLLREGIPSHSEIRQGAVAQMLVDVARQYEAGLIVIGTKGMQGAGPVIVGAIAEQLVRLSPCPVLAVAADWNAGEFRPTPGGPVLLAMERNEATAGRRVDTAYSLAETFHRTLIVLHARGPAEASAFLNPGATTLEEFGIKPSARFPVRCVVKDGNPADAIAEAIAQYHPSMLVAGVKRASETPGPHGTAFALVGTFAGSCAVCSAGTGERDHARARSRIRAPKFVKARAWQRTTEKGASLDHDRGFSPWAHAPFDRTKSGKPGIATSASQRNVRLSDCGNSMRNEDRVGAGSSGDGTMQAEAKNGRWVGTPVAAAGRVVAVPAGDWESAECKRPRCIEVEAGDVVFRQSELGKGLYVIVSGQFAAPGGADVERA